MTCVFFGSRDIIQEKVKIQLRKIIIELIEKKGIDNFYVGNQGSFDLLVQKTLKEIKSIYPHINHRIVLAYPPREKRGYEKIDYSIAFVPDGVENGPQQFAIDRRNRWLIKNSDYVVTCLSTNMGGAAKYKEIAERKGKIIININYYEL